MALYGNITWQRLTFGTVALAGIVLTGSLIYTDYTARQYVAARDVVELLEARSERKAAATGDATGVWTNHVPSWDVDPSGFTYELRVGTNAAVPTNYLVYAGLVDSVASNLYGAPGTLYVVTNRAGLWIWNGYSNITAAGFSHEFEDTYGLTNLAINGNYSISDRQPGATYYTNGLSVTDAYYGVMTVVFVDWGYPVGWTWGVAELAPNFRWMYGSYDGWQSRTNWVDENGLSISGMIFSASALLTNLISSAPAYITDLQAAPVTRAVNRDILIALDADLMALIPQFADDTLASGGSFDAYFATNPAATNIPMLTVTGLFTRLAIGDHPNQFTASPAYTSPAYTNWVYSYSTWFPSATLHSVTYTAQEYHAVNYATNWDGTNYGWGVYTGAAPAIVGAVSNAPTFGAWPIRMSKRDFLERYAVLNALKMTSVSVAWTAGAATNTAVGQYLWQTNCNEFTANVDSRGTNILGAQADYALSGSNDSPPSANTSVGYDDQMASLNPVNCQPVIYWGSYSASVSYQAAKLASAAISTSIAHQVTLYAQFAGDTEFDAYGSGVSTGAMYAIASSGSITSNIFTGGWIGDPALPTPSPFTTNDTGARGWHTVAQCGAVEWSFTRCTNAIPSWPP